MWKPDNVPTVAQRDRATPDGTGEDARVNRFFVERDADRKELSQLLDYHGKVILYGMGGAGKTHLAIDLRRKRERESGAFLLDASTEATLFHGMASIVEPLVAGGYFAQERLEGV